MAPLATRGDQGYDGAGVSNVGGIARGGFAAVVLRALLYPLADQVDLLLCKRVLWWARHPIGRIVVVDGFPEITILDDATVHQRIV